MNSLRLKRIISEAMDNTLYQKHLENALQYVRDNHTWDDDEMSKALDIIEDYRCPISRASFYISDEIYSLMNEYGEENGLPEDWWGGDTDGIFLKL